MEKNIIDLIIYSGKASSYSMEICGDKSEEVLLLDNSQDHLMKSTIVKYLAEEIINLYERVSKVGYKNA